MVEAVNESWKIPESYFFIAEVLDQGRADLVRLCFLKENDANTETISLTCDGPSSYISMLGELLSHAKIRCSDF